MKRQKNKRQIKHIISERTPGILRGPGSFLTRILKDAIYRIIKKSFMEGDSFIRKTRILLTSK